MTHKDDILNIRLSKYYTVRDLTNEPLAARLGLDNIPDGQVIDNMKALSINVLDPLREFLQGPIHIVSCYRSSGVNATLGGDPKSLHLHGKAVDIRAESLTPWGLSSLIYAADPMIPFDEMILAHGSSGWVHLSYDVNAPHTRRISTYDRKQGKIEGKRKEYPIGRRSTPHLKIVTNTEDDKQ